MKKIYFVFTLLISYLSFAKEIQNDALPNLERRIYAMELNIPFEAEGSGVFTSECGKKRMQKYPEKLKAK